MKKKWVIAISVIVLLIVILVILSFTVFSLKRVEIDYRTSTKNLIATDEEIIESGQFKYGSSVFFHGKNNYIEKIEAAYPYIKVINIETVFPSKFVIHVAERLETYAIEHKGQIYICDDQFKVLRITDNFISDQTNAILLEGLKIEDKNYAVGEFMETKGALPIYDAFFENNITQNEQISLIENMEYFVFHDENINENLVSVKLNFFNGQTYLIYNASYGLVYKVELMLDVFSQIYTYIGKTIEFDEQEITLTEQNLKNATIEINNYYDYRVYDEEDCYFKIIPSL